MPVLTEWNEFKQLSLGQIKLMMRQPILVDGRNTYEPSQMREIGFTYLCVGSPS